MTLSEFMTQGDAWAPAISITCAVLGAYLIAENWS